MATFGYKLGLTPLATRPMNDSSISDIDSLDLEQETALCIGGGGGGETITINVGGNRFVLWKKYLSRVPGSRLANLENQRMHYQPQTDEYFYARNAELFQCIYDLYVTGELHLHSNWCGGRIRNELDYWGISEEEYLSKCCKRVIAYYEDNLSRHENMKMVFDQGMSELNKNQHLTRKQRLWRFLEMPTGRDGNVYIMIRTLITVLSVSLYCLGTTYLFRHPAHFPPSTDRTGNETFDNDTIGDNRNSELDEITNPKIYMFKSTHQHYMVKYLDYGCTTFFATEYLVRLIATPSLRKFFKTGLNITDLVCLLADGFVYFTKAFKIKVPYAKYIWGWVYSLKILRVFRLFKSNSKYSGLRVVILAVQASNSELILMSMLLLLGITTFSILIYNAEFSTPEYFLDIPKCGWWVVITMTTVGYGDVYPKTTTGRIVGAICAVTGILFLSLLIPIIAANFTEYYHYALSNKKEAHVQKAHKKSVATNQQAHNSRNALLSRKTLDINNCAPASNTANRVNGNSEVGRNFCQSASKDDFSTPSIDRLLLQTDSENNDTGA